MKLRSRVRRIMMTRGLIAVTTCDQGRSYPGPDDDTERRPCDGQAGEQRRETSQFGEKSVPEFPGLSCVSPPRAPNLTSSAGSCFRSLVDRGAAHTRHTSTHSGLLSALSMIKYCSKYALLRTLEGCSINALRKLL